jgi:hypothetical protein
MGYLGLLQSGCGPANTTGPTPPGTTPPGTTPPGTTPKNHFALKADLEVTAEDLGKDYAADRDAADKKYKDKTVRVTGKVESTQVDDRRVGMTLKTGGPAPLSCGVQGSFENQVKALQEGQEVTVQGILVHWGPGNAFLKTKDEISISGCELGQ